MTELERAYLEIIEIIKEELQFEPEDELEWELRLNLEILERGLRQIRSAL